MIVVFHLERAQVQLELGFTTVSLTLTGVADDSKRVTLSAEQIGATCKKLHVE